jgi:hypothetical protein
MNANEISPKANVRMNRIKIVSRIAKFVMLSVLGFYCWLILIVQLKQTGSVWFQLLADVSTSVPIYVHPVDLCRNLVQNLAPTIIFALWYWKLASLFHLYEKGLIFAAKTIRCLKFLGLLCLTGWLFKCVSNLLLELYPLPPPPPHMSWPVTIVTHGYRFGFFSFDFGTGIDFGLFLTGVVIVLVAWIMDEGRKIQEEQELTV